MRDISVHAQCTLITRIPIFLSTRHWHCLLPSSREARNREVPTGRFTVTGQTGRGQIGPGCAMLNFGDLVGIVRPLHVSQNIATRRITWTVLILRCSYQGWPVCSCQLTSSRSDWSVDWVFCCCRPSDKICRTSWACCILLRPTFEFVQPSMLTIWL